MQKMLQFISVNFSPFLPQTSVAWCLSLYSLCQTLSPSGLKVSSRSVHRVLSVPPCRASWVLSIHDSGVWSKGLLKGVSGYCRSRGSSSLRLALWFEYRRFEERSGMGADLKGLQRQWARDWNEGTHPALSNTTLLTHLEHKRTRDLLDTLEANIILRKLWPVK